MLHKRIAIYSNLIVIFLNLFSLNLKIAYIFKLFTLLTTFVQISCFLLFYKNTAKPKNELELLIQDIIASFKRQKQDGSFYCAECKKYAETENSHCYHCDTCIQERHHHCTWLGSCITSRNFIYFNLMVLFSLFANIMVCYTNTCHYKGTVVFTRVSKFVVFIFTLLQSLFYSFVLVYNIFIFNKQQEEGQKKLKQREHEIDLKMRAAFIRSIKL